MSREQNRGGFFAVGAPQWQKACSEGMNTAVALLTLARGTGKDNRTTSWSADSVYRHTGMSWRRARVAIVGMEIVGLLEVIGKGKRPRYRLAIDTDRLIWIPNELVTGAADEKPPLTLLRQTQEVDLLELLIGLYGEHDLTGDGGLPRRLLYQPYSREQVMTHKQFTVYGFSIEDVRHCRHEGPLAKYGKRPKGQSWQHLAMLERLGLIEWVSYLAESDNQHAELIHPLSGDAAADEVAEAAIDFVSSLPGGYAFVGDSYDYVLPVLNHLMNAAVVGVARLRYRPKTSRTAAWFGQHREDCKKAVSAYRNLIESGVRKAC
jgi:hypothetical protein